MYMNAFFPHLSHHFLFWAFYMKEQASEPQTPKPSSYIILEFNICLWIFFPFEMKFIYSQIHKSQSYRLMCFGKCLLPCMILQTRSMGQATEWFSWPLGHWLPGWSGHWAVLTSTPCSLSASVCFCSSLCVFLYICSVSLFVDVMTSKERGISLDRLVTTQYKSFLLDKTCQTLEG